MHEWKQQEVELIYALSLCDLLTQAALEVELCMNDDDDEE